MRTRTYTASPLRRAQKLLIATLLGVLALAAAALIAPRSASPLRPTPTAAAAVDYFLKLDGIDGESVSVGHVGQIDISSFAFGATQTATAARGTGLGVGRAA